MLWGKGGVRWGGASVPRDGGAMRGDRTPLHPPGALMFCRRKSALGTRSPVLDAGRAVEGDEEGKAMAFRLKEWRTTGRLRAAGRALASTFLRGCAAPE